MAGAKPGVHVLQLKPLNISKTLVDGEKFVKWDEDSPSGTPCTLRVDPNGFFLYWSYYTDQQETDILDIATISDTRINRSTKVPKDLKLKDILDKGSTLTVVHGSNFVDLSYTNFTTQRSESVAKIWADEILKCAYNLLRLNASPMTNLRKTHTRLSILKDKNGRIPLKQVVRVFARQGDDKKRVEAALDACKFPSGRANGIVAEEFTWDRFLLLYNKLTQRVEVERVFCELTHQSVSQDPSRRLKPMTGEQLVSFLNEHQRDPRLNEILYPYADSSKAVEVIAQHEPYSENCTKGVLSFEGFLNFLLGDDNTVISLEKLDLNEDMDQPLSHYFINSSHNTYLIGHQLTGKSSVEMYRQCLLAGCRCVELDFWNGRTDDPVIVHGFTLVPEISAREVIEAIAESAFKTSDWPVVLSFENHCNPRQQARIAEFCKKYFGDNLLDLPLENYPVEPGQLLPPPSALKRKIIIKNKKKHRTDHKKATHGGGGGSGGLGDSQFHVELNQPLGEAGRSASEVQGNGEIPHPPQLEKNNSRDSYPEDAEVANGEIPDGGPDEDESSASDEDEPSPDEEGKGGPTSDVNEEEAGAEISALVNYVQPVHFTSFEVAEKKNRSYEMSSFVETQSLSYLKMTPTEFVNYNKRQLSRVYPKGTRVDSSNFLPHQFWNAGCQLVALNYQTIDLPMQLNLGVFEYNNRSGYLLKPEFMRRPDRRFDPFAESTVDGIIAGTLSVRVISGQFLSEKRAGCYVEVEMYGLPTDTVRKRFRTKTIANNGMNPVWDEEPFIFKKVVLPEMSTVRICAYEEGGSKNLLGHRVLPLVGLRPGYKHIVLRNEKGQNLGLPTLFVHIKVGDYVPLGLSDLAEALANPIKYQNEIEKRSFQLEVFEDDDERGEEDEYGENGPNAAPALSTSPPDPPEPPLSGGLISKSMDANIPPQKPDTPPAGMEGERRRKESTFTKGRQNSISHKQSISAKPSEDRSIMSDIPPILLERFEIKPVELEELFESKGVRERRKKIEKELKESDTKIEKKRQNLLTEWEKKKSNLGKSQKSILKKILVKSASDASVVKSKPPSDLSSQDEELNARLQQLQQDQGTAERRIQDDNLEPLHALLEKSLKSKQASHMKDLETQHESGVDNLKKWQTEFHREQIKLLPKTTSDKQELERKKREVYNNVVAKGTQQRQKLIEVYEKKKSDLLKQQETDRQKLVEDKTKAFQIIKKNYEEKRGGITSERL